MSFGHQGVASNPSESMAFQITFKPVTRDANGISNFFMRTILLDYDEFTIQGFKHIGTGPQDYGQGVVRVDSKAKSKIAQLSKLNRNDLVRVQQRNGQWVTGILRYFDSKEESLLCLEYDDRLELGVNKGESAELYIRKASRLEGAVFFWHHPSPIVRIEFKLAVALASLSVVLGFLAGLLVP